MSSDNPRDLPETLYQDSSDLMSYSVEEQANAFSDCYGLDAQRAQAVFHRLAESSWPSTVSKPPGLIVDEVAIGLEEPSQALDIFEHENLDQLFVRVHLLDYLGCRRTPLYSLDELAERTAAFISHLERNRENLVNTGYPETNFPQSLWLSSLLGKLHCVKSPAEVCMKPSMEDLLKDTQNDKVTQDERGFPIHHCNYTYRWAWELPPYKGQRVTWCDYDDAGLIGGIDHYDARDLEEMRSVIFDLRVKILKSLFDAVCRQNATTLWQDCLRLLTESLSADDISSLLFLDHSIAEAHSGFRRPADPLSFDLSFSKTCPTTGLGNLLTVIGHYEKELTIGTLHKTREHLRGPALLCMCYYNTIGQPWRKAVDTALDHYIALEAKEYESFWPAFKQQVNHCLKTEFYDEVVLRINIKRPFVHQFEPLVQSYAEFVKRQLHTLGTPPSITLTSSKQRPYKDVFEHSDDFLSIKFRGKDITLTSMQAQVIEFMFQEHESGRSEIHHGRILAEIGCKSSRLRDLCRSTKELWNNLIVHGSRRGMYRLNIFD